MDTVLGGSGPSRKGEGLCGARPRRHETATRLTADSGIETILFLRCEEQQPEVDKPEKAKAQSAT
ncbi:MAG: hypothetical protein DMG98_24430 [Acidobacteria bacterium]|nr:MAG: hypothetical protein DMG98_24430 [Acidobacteriota bacterium]